MLLTDRRTAAFTAVVLISLVVLFAPRTPSEQGIPHIDKLVHGTLFLALAVTTRWRFGPRLAGLVAVLAYAAASELVQQRWLAQRDGDVKDFAADAVGALLGWLLARRVLSRAR
ncbi:MAG: VanZ family protein [Actinobacteria bacterium]|nr:VanZ family protein [Actinomycetota bacterium]MCA1721413.1 VanZ family protein [Actinomycetota bacterium]